MSKFKLAHVVWDCKYHIVLVPKYRYTVFNQEVRESVKDELKKLRFIILHHVDLSSNTVQYQQFPVT